MINNELHHEVYAEIEHRCILNCMHCSSLHLKKDPSIGFDISDLIGFLNKINAKAHLYLTGGEPLLYNNLVCTIRKIKDSIPSISTGIFTCGIGIGRKPISVSLANELKAAGLDDCYISLYHTVPQKHDAVTGFAGSYDITSESINNLLLANIDIKAHLVITKFNFLDFFSILSELVEKKFSQIRILRIVETGNAINNWEKIGVSYSEQNHIIQNVIDYISHYDSKVTISGFPSQVACRPFPGAQKCQAGISLFYISGDGGVYPCACTRNNKNFLIGRITEHHKIAEFIEKQKLLLFNEGCLNPISN